MEMLQLLLLLPATVVVNIRILGTTLRHIITFYSAWLLHMYGCVAALPPLSGSNYNITFICLQFQCW